MLGVTLYGQDRTQPPIEVEVDYVSFVNADTYGPPPLIAPGDNRRANEGEVVLYINTSVVPAFEIERLPDDG